MDIYLTIGLDNPNAAERFFTMIEAKADLRLFNTNVTRVSDRVQHGSHGVNGCRDANRRRHVVFVEPLVAHHLFV